MRNFFGIALLLALPASAVAQVGYPPKASPFRDIRKGHTFTVMGGYFKGIDLTDPQAAAEKLKIGTRVTTTFAAERKGEMLDFWFELEEGQVA